MSRPRKRAFSRVLSHFLHLCSTFITLPPSRLFLTRARIYIMCMPVGINQSHGLSGISHRAGTKQGQLDARQHTKSIAASLLSQGSSDALAKVDLEGIEPSSKRGNHTLSTCLVLYWKLSGRSLRREHP